MANLSQQQNTTSSIALFSTSECIAWLTVFGMEALAIVTLNALTSIVCLTERSLRKNSMYLVINLAVADMFVGASVIVYSLVVGHTCHLWTLYDSVAGFFSMHVLRITFPAASFFNLAAISLERAHATFRPFKHRLLKKKVFGTTVAIVWITAGLSSTGIVLIRVLQTFRISIIVQILFILLLYLTFVVPYSSITIKIVCGSQPHHHGATSRERKLTKTLFIVTVASLLLTLPFTISKIFLTIRSGALTRTYFRLEHFFCFLLYANSLVNPVIYTFRMPGFRRALFYFFNCRSQPQSAPVFPLNEM